MSKITVEECKQLLSGVQTWTKESIATKPGHTTSECTLENLLNLQREFEARFPRLQEEVIVCLRRHLAQLPREQGDAQLDRIAGIPVYVADSKHEADQIAFEQMTLGRKVLYIEDKS